MRGFNCRSLRLELVAGLLTVLALSLFTGTAAAAQSATTATLSVTQTLPVSCTTNIAIAIASAGGTPTGTVSIEDNFTSPNQVLASEVLDANGHANVSFALATGTHTLTALYVGNASFQSSTSTSVSVTAPVACNLTVAISLLNPDVTAGQASAASVSVIPLASYSNSLTGPAFITLSCSGLPAESSCTFTPENVEISPGSVATALSNLTVQTAAQSGSLKQPVLGRGAASIAWALLLPGMVGLGWLGRRRALLIRLSLLALVCGLVSMGASGCSARYGYLNHGPPHNHPTPPGTYTLTVTAQTSNGVTASVENALLNLTVK